MPGKPTRHASSEEPASNPRSPSRRVVLKTGAAIGLGAFGAGEVVIRARQATPGAESTPTECVLTPELTEGPYYLDGQLIRRDVTEGKPGAPLGLRISVQDITTCQPLANAAVDIWHCDAQVYYSGISGENPGGGSPATGDENLTTTFLRGVQLTDENGAVEFDTIYPGWYGGRTVHIHMKVLVEGEAGAATADPEAMATPEGGETYQSGHTAHVGQLFFDDAISEEVFATDAYARSSEDGKIGNAEDNIFADHGDDPGFLVELAGSVADGFTGEITVGVDPKAAT
jgi:protocatechuate 3,4-dioxygenase beta subunit